MKPTSNRDHPQPGRPRHCVLIHDGPASCLEGLRSFLDTSARGAPVLAVVTAQTHEMIAPLLGPSAAYLDVSELGRNPARVIPAIQQFVESQDPSARVRVVTEQWWEQRVRAERAELARHEALTNMAFDGHEIDLVCLYDTRKVTREITADALRTHPCVVEGSAIRDNPAFVPPETVIELSDRAVEPPPSGAYSLDVEPGHLSGLRAVVEERGVQAGLPSERVEDLVLAANEVATNCVSHGDGHGKMRLWTDESWLVCEVVDAGQVDDPLAGRRPPPVEDTTGRGLWMVNQLCDLVELRSSPAGTAVRLRFALPRSVMDLSPMSC